MLDRRKRVLGVELRELLSSQLGWRLFLLRLDANRSEHLLLFLTTFLTDPESLLKRLDSRIRAYGSGYVCSGLGLELSLSLRVSKLLICFCLIGLTLQVLLYILEHDIFSQWRCSCRPRLNASSHLSLLPFHNQCFLFPSTTRSPS